MNNDFEKGVREKLRNIGVKEVPQEDLEEIAKGLRTLLERARSLSLGLNEEAGP